MTPPERTYRITAALRALHVSTTDRRLSPAPDIRVTRIAAVDRTFRIEEN